MGKLLNFTYDVVLRPHYNSLSILLPSRFPKNAGMRRPLLCKDQTLFLRRALSLTPKHSIAAKTCYSSEEEKDKEEEEEEFPCVQTLSNFPREELKDKIVLLRFDSSDFLREDTEPSSLSFSTAASTIKYLLEARAKVLLVSAWRSKKGSKFVCAKSFADVLSLILRHKVVFLPLLSHEMPLESEILTNADVFLLENLAGFKEEVANCPEFARLLSSGVDIFVNDSFSVSHKVLASTVGVARFCYACVAGFHFEESLSLLKKAAETNGKPYVAIVGGGNLCDKEPALQFIASRCDGLVFVGMMSFQIMHALGLQVPSHLLEPGAQTAASSIVQIARDRNVPILYPMDFWCMNDQLPNHIELIPAHGITNDWLPVDLGPVSLDNITSLLANSQKILWIGPVKFKSSSQDLDGALKLSQMLRDQSKRNCDIFVVGQMASRAMRESSSLPSCRMVEHATALWEFFKGRKLPGMLALDRGYTFDIDWGAVYDDPTRPLAVDIGSGNGLFLLRMASQTKDVNFLGLEINKKLVRRCLDSIHQSGIKNGYFITTNATSAFRSIVSSYPGKLVLVSIQCPNPDFNNPENRWRMLQRSLVEAVADLLAFDGKVFLQSDIEAVMIRMKDLFLKYGKDKITLLKDQYTGERGRGLWLDENPFGIRSDWEQHVVDRGAPMYRLMLCRSNE